MREIGTLFLGMGIGYMNQGLLYFWFPMLIGLFFLIIDIIYEHKIKQKQDKT